MNIYIGLIMFSTVMFSVQFLCNSIYQKKEGHTFVCSAVFSFLNAAFGFILLFIISGFRLEFSAFSAVVTALSAIKNVLLAFFSIKVFKYANLSVYSMFSMLGGMLLPFVYALAFGGEKMTLPKGICVSLIIAALIIGTVGLGHGKKNEKGEKTEKDEKSSKKAYFYYFGVFFLNGLSGVFAKLHQLSPNAVSSESYSMLERVFMMTICLAVIFGCIFTKKSVRLSKPAVSIPTVALAATMNALGNLILLKALFHVDASVQYPIVTGGVIIVSMIMDAIMGKKPTVSEIVSTGVSFVGLMLLVI